MVVAVDSWKKVAMAEVAATVEAAGGKATSTATHAVRRGEGQPSLCGYMSRLSTLSFSTSLAGRAKCMMQPMQKSIEQMSNGVESTSYMF